MSLLPALYVLVGLYSCHSATVFVGKDEAHGGLIRTKRANLGWFEELKMGNLERECLEETCSYEEAREVFEHTEATNEFWKIYDVKDLCVSDPCKNNGLCTTQNTASYTCLCLPGFSGRSCEQAIKDVPDSCLHDNGRCEHFCVEEGARRNCSCADGYFLEPDGQKCQTHENFPCGKIPLLGGGAAMDLKDTMRSRIVGGAECPRGHCPWQVLLKYGQKGFCGGVIFKPTWVLTAAHCLEKLKLKFLTIVAGEHDIEMEEGTEQVIQVEQMLTHPGYVSETSDNDIALLRLSKPIAYDTYAVPVCLPLRDMAERELWAVSKHMVSGWGKRSEDGPTSRLLRRLQVPRIRTQECTEVSNVTLTRNMFCAGYFEGKQDSCKGDSGGPLVTRYRDTTFLLGIVSWGKGCARPGYYGIYTRISNYLQWIQQQTTNSTAAAQSSIHVAVSMHLF